MIARGRLCHATQREPLRWRVRFPREGAPCATCAERCDRRDIPSTEEVEESVACSPLAQVVQLCLPMKTHSLAAFALVFVGSTALARLAAADVAPTCSSFDDMAPCTFAESGQTCSNGGTCRMILCLTADAGPMPGTIHRCVACPPYVADENDGGTACSPQQTGQACGKDGKGTCKRIPAHCALVGASGFQCVGETPTLPPWDGGPTTTGGSTTTTTTGVGGAGGTSNTGTAGAGGASTTGTAGAAGTGITGTGGAGTGGSDSTTTTTGAGGAAGTGATTGTGGTTDVPGDDAGGCTIAAHSFGLSLPRLLSPLMLAVGAGALLLDRRRRRGH